MPLSPRDESLLLSLLECGPSLAFLIRRHKMTLQEALDWWRQPHIKQALADLADLSQARAKAIASNDAMQAVSALQSSLILCESEFCEQADPRTRLKAFESARKAAVQVLKLAGIPSAGSRAPSRASSRAITRGSARVMSPAPAPRAISPGPARVISPDAPTSRAPSCAITRGSARVMSRAPASRAIARGSARVMSPRAPQAAAAETDLVPAPAMTAQMQGDDPPRSQGTRKAPNRPNAQICA